MELEPLVEEFEPVQHSWQICASGAHLDRCQLMSVKRGKVASVCWTPIGASVLGVSPSVIISTMRLMLNGGGSTMSSFRG